MTDEETETAEAAEAAEAIQDVAVMRRAHTLSSRYQVVAVLSLLFTVTTLAVSITIMSALLSSTQSALDQQSAVNTELSIELQCRALIVTESDLARGTLLASIGEGLIDLAEGGSEALKDNLEALRADIAGLRYASQARRDSVETCAQPDPPGEMPDE